MQAVQNMNAFLILLPIGILAFPQMVKAQMSAGSVPDAAMVASGGIQDPFAKYYQPAGNPAALSGAPVAGVAVFTHHPFGLSALSTTMISGWHGMGGGGLGAAVGYSGFGGMRQVALFLGFGHRLWNRIDAGIQLEGQEVHFEDYGRVRMLGLQGGLRFTLLEGVAVASALRYPVVKGTHSVHTIPASLSTSLAWRVSPGLQIAAEWYQERSWKPDVRAGITYFPVRSVAIRLGYQSLSGSFLAGAGYLFRENWQVDLAGGYHPFLGFSPTAGLRYQIPR